MSYVVKKMSERVDFNNRVSDMANLYNESEPRSLGARNLISRRRFALEMLESGLSHPLKILDAGCGTGEIVGQLIRHGHEVWGLDISEAMIRYAKENCAVGRFQHGDIEHLPFRDNTFDVVVCLGVLEYLNTSENALREIIRVLKPGGRAVISTPNATFPLYYVDRALVGLKVAVWPLYRFLKYSSGGRPAPAHQSPKEIFHRRYYPGRWLRLLSSVGLEPQESVCHGWGWYRTWHLELLLHFLSRLGGMFRHSLGRFLGRSLLNRAVDGIVRNRALNWLLSEQIVRVRAVKKPVSPQLCWMVAAMNATFVIL